MPSLRSIRKKPELDMNPMVDMAFLLVSFFMMATTFKAELPEEVRIPASTSEVKLPESSICTITIGSEGTVYFGLDNTHQRARLLDAMSSQYGVNFSEDQRYQFSLISGFGVPVQQLPDLLNARIANQPFAQGGIPHSDDGEELRQWILQARMAQPRLRFAINADGAARWPEVEQVIELLRDLNITRFNIITELKTPADAPAD